LALLLDVGLVVSLVLLVHIPIGLPLRSALLRFPVVPADVLITGRKALGRAEVCSQLPTPAVFFNHYLAHPRAVCRRAEFPAAGAAGAVEGQAVFGVPSQTQNSSSPSQFPQFDFSGQLSHSPEVS
jgi:hypothetical protein